MTEYSIESKPTSKAVFHTEEEVYDLKNPLLLRVPRVKSSNEL